MRNAKKILAILLTFALCFSLCAVMTSAETDFNPKVKLSASYTGYDNGEVSVVVTTSQACGAISGTLTYTGATYVSAKANENGTDQFVQTEGQVKFVIVTDKLTADGGDFAWATIKFKDIKSTAKFELKDVKVCDVGASDLKSPDALTIEDVKPITVIGTLGSQYREPKTDITAGLRFAAKIVRTKGTDALPNLNNKTAVSCGFLIGFADNIVSKNSLTDKSQIDLKSFVTNVNTDDYTLNIPVGKGVLARKSQYYKASENDYLVCTLVVEGLDNYADKDIVFLPYVVYNGDDGLEVAYGTQINRNFNEVKNAFNFVSNIK